MLSNLQTALVHAIDPPGSTGYPLQLAHHVDTEPQWGQQMPAADSTAPCA